MNSAKMTMLLAAGLMLALQPDKLEAGCPDEPRGVTELKFQSCYEFIKDSDYQPDAKRKCNQNGGHLLMIRSKEEQMWLETYIREELQWYQGAKAINGIWLGLYRVPNTQKWQWDTGNGSSRAHLSYENWEEREPDTVPDRDCARFGMDTKFQWRSTLCKEWPFDYAVICQYDGAGGFFSKQENVIGFAIGMITFVVFIVIAIVCIFYCYKKRQHLRRRLRCPDDPQVECKEGKILNTDTDSIVTNSSDNTPPPYYGEVPSADPNLLDTTISSYKYKKEKDMDIKLNVPPYRRTQSEPGHCMNIQQTYRCPAPSAPPCPEVDEEAFNESFPLHHTLSNDLS